MNRMDGSHADRTGTIRQRRQAGACAALVATAFSAGCATASAGSDLETLESYAADFINDPFLTAPVEFGVRVGDEMYAVSVAPAAEGADARSTVSVGAPSAPSFYYTVEDSAWLAKVESGEINALTSMAKAFQSDPAPMDIEVMDGFQPDENFGAWIVPFTFHFWTRGMPEIVRFGPEMTRETHGANAGVFYYQPGLRSAWFDIRPGQHVNADEASRTNPFPSMMILTEGSVTAIIGGVETTFEPNTMMFIPAGVSHEFINETDAPAFGFLFMFGEGA